MITRRDLFQTLTTAAIAIAVPPAPRPRFGRLTVEMWMTHKRQTGETLHVWVNGRDVTWHCREADDVDGYAIVYCRDRAHHADLDGQDAIHVDINGGGACAVRLTGTVMIAPGVPPSHG